MLNYEDKNEVMEPNGSHPISIRVLMRSPEKSILKETDSTTLVTTLRDFC